MEDPAIAKEIKKKFNPIDGKGESIVIVSGGVNSQANKDAKNVLRKSGKLKN
jgi:hypothetical protein